MQTASSQILDQASCEPESRPTLNVVIIYEDFASGKHAKATYDYLVNQLGRDFEFSSQMWKFDVLGIPKMRQMAVKDATASDLVVVSTHGAGELPAEVKLWVDEWTENKGNVRALVTLVDRPKDLFAGDPSIRRYLEDAAKKANVDFFAQPDDWPDRNEDDFSLEQISERAQKTSVMVADLIHNNGVGSHWGINE